MIQRKSKPARVLLKSSWQTVNIGDIGHTPGMLRLLEKHLPEVEVTLWPSHIGDGVEEMLRRNFPRLRIAMGGAARQAFDECDFLLHGSGPALAAEEVALWRKATGKPYGACGIGFSGLVEASHKELFEGAEFLFFRDSLSLARAKHEGITGPYMEFGPDAAFAADVRADAQAEAFLRGHGLEEGKFLCCIPRLRHSPYWLIPAKNKLMDPQKEARNEEMKESDHAVLRKAIIAVTRQTSCKILLCPEDATQMAVGKDLLWERLPSDVRSRMVWREKFWLTDEAISTYARSSGIFGFEMHSPIMALAHGVPALVGRWSEMSTKGFMWRDIGLDKWLFDIDRAEDVERFTPTVLSLVEDPSAARIKAAGAMERVRERQKAMMAALGRVLAR